MNQVVKKHSETLVSFFSDLFVYINELNGSLKKGESPSFSEVRKTITSKIDESVSKNIIQSGEVGEQKIYIYSEKNLKVARFAVVALVDEMIIGSSWSERTKWVKNPLQKELFSSLMAGSEFFENIDSIRDLLSFEERDVYEIYYYCLAMGFEGVHYDAPEKLSELIRKMHDRLSRYDMAHQTLMLREPESASSKIREFRLNKSLIIILIILALIGLIFLMYFLELRSVSEAVINLLSIYGTNASDGLGK